MESYELQIQSLWESMRLFESNPDPSRPKFFITVPYPYPSGSMHVGHGRTYTIPDIILKYKRMKGFNTLYPMGFHVTGTPVVGISRRISRGDPEAIKLYRDLYRVPPHILQRFEDPNEIVDYFSKEYRDQMTKLGLSIDWRRSFKTSDIHYQKFIHWQYLKLYQLGLIKKGTHPVRWCPWDKNPVGDHDLLSGEHASVLEYTLLKFRQDSRILPAATLRPETIFGATNLWINPRAKYLEIQLGSEIWVISEQAFPKIQAQLGEPNILREIDAQHLIKSWVIAPLTQSRIPILPAEFVDPDFGTGIVFSVPAHDPHDYIALKEIGSHPEYSGLVRDPIPVIHIQGYQQIPAAQLCSEWGIKSQLDPRLDQITQILYRDELFKGRMIQDGSPVSDARERIKHQLLETNQAALMYEFSERPVICRCGAKCLIKLIQDQWFLRYSDPDWKSKSRECLNGMQIFPRELSSQFQHVLEWLKDWACTRKIGLGTRFPWDASQIIEPLSDSTIYMAYYTISHLIRDLDPESLTPEVFDQILIGSPPPHQPILERMRSEFIYWYPYDFRFSGKDLVGNHLSFQIFHHAAIFPKDYWPRGMVIFGLGLFKGEKMSSSKGNVELLGDALQKYGADLLRLSFASLAEPWQDFEWDPAQIEALGRRFRGLKNLIQQLSSIQPGDRSNLDWLDRWILHRFQIRIQQVNTALEEFKVREAIQAGLYEFESELRWYLSRADLNSPGTRWCLGYIFEEWLKLLAPFIPHFCEWIWRNKYQKGSILDQSFPSPDPELMNPDLDNQYQLMMRLIQDIKNICRVAKLSPRKIYLYVCSPWKTKLLEKIYPERDINKAIKLALADPEFEQYSSQIPGLIKKMISWNLAPIRDEPRLLAQLIPLLSREMGCHVELQEEQNPRYDPLNRAKDALPGRPGIYVE